jgi:alpha-ketoglutarate-dependent taurine dioxygenase
MKVELLENDWTVQVSDIDVKNMTVGEGKVIGKLFLSNLVVVIKDQQMTAEENLDFCKHFGKIDSYSRSKLRERLSESVAVADGVARVTGALDDDGKPGLFAMKEELDWHTNGTEAHNNIYHGACFYGVKGTVGSRTSWMNLSRAYHDLPEDVKEKIKELHAYTKTPHKEEDDPIVKIRRDFDEIWWERRSKIAKKVHFVNEIGTEGMIYPHLFMEEFEGYTVQEREELHSFMCDHVLQEKYHYHHDWVDGDVVLSEQRMTQHKRWAFDDIENRLLYRTSFDFRNVGGK